MILQSWTEEVLRGVDTEQMLASEQFLLRLARMAVPTTSCLVCALLCAHCLSNICNC